MSRIKQSTGDIRIVNPYMHKFVGQEVTTSKIIRLGKQIIIKIFTKRL